MQGKLKIYKFSLKASVQNLCNISSQKFCNLFLFLKAFQRAIKSQNPMIGSRSKFRFSWLKVNNYWKSPKNVNSLRPILSPKNAKKGRGPREPPPPAGIKVIMQGKLFQRCIYLLYCSVLSLVGNVNTGRMSQADMGSIFNTKNK